MRRILIFVYAVFLVIILANVFYYRDLYKKQLNYIITLLNRQVQIVGLSVDSTNNYFVSDLNEINYSEDLAMFFSNPQNKYMAEEKMKLFFSKYQDFVTGIKLFDNNKNEYTLKKDGDTWLPQQFVLHVQGKIFDMEKPVLENRTYEYYLPVIKNNTTVANLVVTVDYKKYFAEIFSVFQLEDYQWQWVVSDSGEIIFSNNKKRLEINEIEKITSALSEGSSGNIIHHAKIDDKSKELISAYYSTQLLQRDLGLVFSAPTDFFQRYLKRNSLFIGIGTLILIQTIIFIFWRFINSQKSEISRLGESEKMLFRLIDEMPVGVIIHNKNREIIKANKVAATQYAYPGEEEMIGKIFPETSVSDASEYFAKNLGGSFNPSQFVVIKKEIGEIVLYRNSFPVIFRGEEATMEILIDVTMLESARKQEAKANVAKSEFLARMSYEIRTPLNGIIGMADILSKYDLSNEVKNIVSLLRRSTEVLLSIINDILDFSKIETGKMILDEVPYNLREEISYCIDLAKTNVSANELSVSCTVGDNVPESIIGDPFRLRQILTNLLNNSIRNTQKGEIRLDCRLQSNKNGIITLGFKLQDTGISFDKASLKKIFGDFVNIESKAVKNADESGFGTILARQIVEMMGGQLIAESPSGISADKGTKVFFTIQTYSNDKPVKSLNVEKITSFDKIKTLIITGNQIRNEQILGSFHKLGLDISVTTFQKSTPSQIKSSLNHPDDKYSLIVMLDNEGFNGFDVAKSIWENNLSVNFIELLISANDKKGNFKKCITLGIDHYMVKPYDISELINVLQESFPFIERQSDTVNVSNIKDNIRILVVEDNKLNQKTMGAMLKNLGYSYDLADNGKEGYIQARTKKYDLIFMDLILPEMDGFETSRKILQSDSTVLIIAFTADNMPESKRKAELSGIKEFITKPVRIEDLKQLFARHFKKE
ncbi:MAG: response regulator [Bacteroidales bacterium]|nr:response regulator [Bacteroidales bacterium]